MTPKRSATIFLIYFILTRLTVACAVSFRANVNKVISVTTPEYGAVCDGVTDDTVAIKAAYSAAGPGTTVQFPAAPSGCLVSSTISIPTQTRTIAGVSATFPGGSNFGGTYLKYASGSTGSAIKLFDTAGTTLSGLGVLCAGSNQTGILIDSDNTPSASQNSLDHFSIQNCHIGIQVGTSGSAPAYQSDSNDFSDFQIFGLASDLMGEGIVSNSSNTGPAHIRNFTIVNVHAAFDFQNYGTNWVIGPGDVGTLVGTNPATFDWSTSTAVNPLMIMGVEDEPGSATTSCTAPNAAMSIYDAAGANLGDTKITMIGNNWAAPLCLLASAVYTSIGNSFQAGIISPLAQVSGATAVLTTFGDNFAWKQISTARVMSFSQAYSGSTQGLEWQSSDIVHFGTIRGTDTMLFAPSTGLLTATHKGGVNALGTVAVNTTISWPVGTQTVTIDTSTTGLTYTFSTTGAQSDVIYTLKSFIDAGPITGPIWAGPVKWAGASAPVSSGTGGFMDIIRLYFDGVNFWEVSRALAVR